VTTVLVDSDILIDVSRARDPAILARWDRMAASEAMILCSPVTFAELWHGARAHEHKALETLFGELTCLPIDAEIGRRAGEYLNRYSRSHSLEIADALIAATASVHKVELWTRNRRHYPMKDVRFH
jgi:predicted nucleic acid-binding protein